MAASDLLEIRNAGVATQSEFPELISVKRFHEVFECHTKNIAFACC